MKTINKEKEPIQLSEIQERLKKATGKQYWRSLEELAETEAFQELVQREFPQGASEWVDPLSRRNFIKLMGASMAMAGITGCGFQPAEKIIPYVQQPENLIPGKPLYFATAVTLGGFATGVLVESHMGRPTKIEGNPNHPASKGSTGIIEQASILNLYDPDRAQVITRAGRIRTWDDFMTVITGELNAQSATNGEGLRILTETVTSPTLAYQLKQLLKKYPNAKWHQYEPANRDSVRAGSRLSFGEVVHTRYQLDKADVILSLDADFLSSGPGWVRYARDFSKRRKAHDSHSEMNRLYSVESTPTVTGAMADHHLPLQANEIENFARMLAKGLSIDVEVEDKQTLPDKQNRWIKALVGDLQKHRGSSLVMAGDQQAPIIHALAHAINEKLGNVGRTVVYTEPVEANSIDQGESLRDLVDDMKSGKVETLMILGGNPVYHAPADLNFAKQLEKVGMRVHLGSFQDETSALCHWHIPESHFLESWSDARAYDGAVTIMQPLIKPLYSTKSAHELLAALLGKPNRNGYDVVKEYWKSQKLFATFEKGWRKALHDGVVQDSAFSPKSLKVHLGRLKNEPSRPQKTQDYEIVFRADPTIWDGRFANNGWLQELPKPSTRLTWDNAALVSPSMAEKLKLSNGDVVSLQHKEFKVEAPIWITPGQAKNTVTVHLGYGRTRTGRVGAGAGFNAYAIRTSVSPWSTDGLTIQKTGREYPLSTTQDHHSMQGRDLIRVRSTSEHEHQEESHHTKHLSIYPKHEYKDNSWGMVIDLNTCSGCNACMVACQSENNIPVVGKTEVGRGREMHWIRVDRYYKGDLENPETYHQPVPCMHCENAPCEVVCPVAATVHSSEGLNEMIYNRCIGTRYCSNNCPYKVRRFNFFTYSDLKTPSIKLMQNPDVTVRDRGVMEKCTYCVQRINVARIQAKKEDREIKDGEIQTACQAVCPMQAIVFGNINDPKSEVSKLKAKPSNYSLLEELNVFPRTTYLEKVRNPNPVLEMDHG